jgi:hypothetical protein
MSMIWNTSTCSSSGFFRRLKIIGGTKALWPQVKDNRCMMIPGLHIYHCFKMRGFSIAYGKHIGMCALTGSDSKTTFFCYQVNS